MNQIQWMLSLVMIGLFTVAIIGFAANFAVTNEAPINILNDQNISNLRENTQGDLSSLESSGTNTYASIVNSSINPSSASGTLPNVGPFSLTFQNLFSLMNNILRIAYDKIFGSDPNFAIFFTAFGSIIAIITGLLLWKTLKGEPSN